MSAVGEEPRITMYLLVLKAGTKLDGRFLCPADKKRQLSKWKSENFRDDFSKFCEKKHRKPQDPLLTPHPCVWSETSGLPPGDNEPVPRGLGQRCLRTSELEGTWWSSIIFLVHGALSSNTILFRSPTLDMDISKALLTETKVGAPRHSPPCRPNDLGGPSVEPTGFGGPV